MKEEDNITHYPREEGCVSPFKKLLLFLYKIHLSNMFDGPFKIAIGKIISLYIHLSGTVEIVF